MAAQQPSAAEQAHKLEEEKKAAEQQIENAATEAGAQAAATGATPEQVKDAVEKARKEEKDKLYPQLDALKQSITEIQEAFRAEREEKESLKREAADKEERRRLEKMSDSDKQLEAIKKIEEQLREEREERKKMQYELAERDRVATIQAYRATLLQAAGDEIIPELVRGNTKEEIEASFAIAKARYAELAQSIKTATGAQVRQNMPRSTNPDTAALEEQELSEQLSAVNTDRYRTDAEYRDKIKGELERAYEQAAGRI